MKTNSNLPTSSSGSGTYNKKYTDRNLNSITKPPASNSLASQQGKLLVLNPVSINRLGKSSAGVSAAPTPVNTSSLKSEKEKEGGGLVPVGTNVWVNSSGGSETGSDSKDDSDNKTQTRPAPWTSSKSQTDSDAQEGQSASATSEALKQAKRRSWADSDDDDDDDPPEKPTPPAPYAVPPSTAESRQSIPSHASHHQIQDVRYLGDRDGRMDRSTNNRPFSRDNQSTGWQQPPDRDFNKSRFESHNLRGRGSEGREYEGRGYENRFPPQSRFEGGRGHSSFPNTSQNRPQSNGFNTSEWSSGSGNRSHTSSENVPEEQIALEQARLERELLEKKRQEEAMKREKERQIAEKERLRIEEERKQNAYAELQRRQQSIQQHVTRQEEKWERGKLPPHPPPSKPVQPKSPREHDRAFHHSSKVSSENEARKGFSDKSENHHFHESSEDFHQRKILQSPKHLYDPKSSSMVETSHVQKGPQRFDRGEESHDKNPRTEDKKAMQVPAMTADEIKAKAEAREARAKAKLGRPPRTAGVLYRYDENGALERVLTEAEKQEIAEKEELRKVAKETREKHFKLTEKKKFEKFSTNKVKGESVPEEPEARISDQREEGDVEKTDTSPTKDETEGSLVMNEIPPHEEPSQEPLADSNESKEPEVDLDCMDQLEISSDDARQQSIEFVEVKSKRTIYQERKEVKGKDSLIVTPPIPPRVVPDKPAPKKSTMEVIPPADESPRQGYLVPAPSTPAWQAPHATLEVLGVPSPASTSETVPLSVDDPEPKADQDEKNNKKHREREVSKPIRKRREDDSDDNTQTARRGTGRVDTSAAKMHLLRNSTSSRQRSNRQDTQDKVQEEEDRSEVDPIPSSSSAEEKLETQVSGDSIEEVGDVDVSTTTSGRGRGRGRESTRGRNSRRGGLMGRREVRMSPRVPDSQREDSSMEYPEDDGDEPLSSRGGDRGTRGRRGSFDRDGGRRAYKARGIPLRERITRGPPAYSANPE